MNFAPNKILPILALPLNLAAGCRHIEAQQSGSNVRVTNGAFTNRYPAVVELINSKTDDLCTGTFVSDTVVLTAAHCLDDSPSGGLAYGDIRSLSNFHDGGIGEAEILKADDFAIVIFPPGSAPRVQLVTGPVPSTLPIAAVVPEAGTPVTVIGFGEATVGKLASAGVKRLGTNTVAGISSGYIHVVGVASPAVVPTLGDGSEGEMQGPAPLDEASPAMAPGIAPATDQAAASPIAAPSVPMPQNQTSDATAKVLQPGQEVATAAGDSGSPLLVNDAVTGTDTGGGLRPDGKKHSFYIKLAGAAACKLLLRAKAAGADLPALPEACAAGQVGTGGQPVL